MSIKNKIQINIPKDFSEYTGGRYKVDKNGNPQKYSGEEFYEVLLNPNYSEALRDGKKLEIILDGGRSYMFSFFNEAFVRLAQAYDPKEINEKLIIVSNIQPYWEDEIRKYIFE